MKFISFILFKHKLAELRMNFSSGHQKRSLYTITKDKSVISEKASYLIKGN